MTDANLSRRAFLGGVAALAVTAALPALPVVAQAVPTCGGIATKGAWVLVLEVQDAYGTLHNVYKWSGDGAPDWGASPLRDDQAYARLPNTACFLEIDPRVRRHP